MISFIVTYWFHLAAAAIIIAMWSKIRCLQIEKSNCTLQIQTEKQNLWEALTELRVSDLRRIQLVSKLEQLETENFELAFENEELKEDKAEIQERCTRLAKRIVDLENQPANRTVTRRPQRKCALVKRRTIIIRRPAAHKPNMLHRVQKVSR